METWQAPIIGQGVAVRTLDGVLRSSERGRFLLLHGPQGVGKSLAARRLASQLLCRDPSPLCGNCLGCREPETHPDAGWFEPEKAGGSIKIDPIREARKQVFFPPVSAPNRVWVIDPMERLTVAAANTILRLLEEPPSRMWTIGVTHNLSAVPITLRSRAYKIPFTLLDAPSLRAIAGEQVPAEAGTVQRAQLLSDQRFARDWSAWQQLLGDRWYNPDSIVKFSRSVGGRGAGLREFLTSTLLTYSIGAAAGDLGAPYAGPLAGFSDAQWHAYLEEREVLQRAIVDLDNNVNPGFVCEDCVRTIRRIRKQLAASGRT